MRFVIVCVIYSMVLSVAQFPRAAAAPAPAQIQVRNALNNQDVAQMVKARFPDTTILKVIQANDTDFDLSVPAMVSLKSLGVSQLVIEAMLSAGANKKTASSVPPPAGAPTSHSFAGESGSAGPS